MLLIGAGAAKAQNDKGYEAKPLTGENAAMAQQVMDQQLEQPDKAYAVFLKMFKNIKNDKDELINVGDFFLNKRVFPLAKKCADQLYTIAPTYIPGLMFEGRVALLRHVMEMPVCVLMKFCVLTLQTFLPLSKMRTFTRT